MPTHPGSYNPKPRPASERFHLAELPLFPPRFLKAMALSPDISGDTHQRYRMSQTPNDHSRSYHDASRTAPMAMPRPSSSGTVLPPIRVLFDEVDRDRTTFVGGASHEGSTSNPNGRRPCTTTMTSRGTQSRGAISDPSSVPRTGGAGGGGSSTIPRTDVWHYNHRHRSLLDPNYPIPNGVWKLVFNAESGSLPGTAMSELLLFRGMLDPNDRPFEASGLEIIRVRIRFSQLESCFADINVKNQTRQQIATAVAREHQRAIQRRGFNYDINALRLKGMFYEPDTGIWQPVVTIVIPSG